MPRSSLTWLYLLLDLTSTFLLAAPLLSSSLRCASFAKTGTCTYQDYGFVVNDHVEQANAPPANGTTCEAATLEIPGVDGVFELLQFHVHTNSEHTMDGNRYGAELHMVHKLRDGDRLAVVGLFLQANAFVNDALFSNVLAGFDGAADAAADLCNVTLPDHWWSHGNASFADADANATVNVYGLIPANSTFYRYDGGLTTPPCSEIVTWNVADTPLSVSVAQYNDLAGLILNYLSPDTCEFATIASPSGSTSRPVQLLNNRTVERICPVGYKDDSSSNKNNSDGGGGSGGDERTGGTSGGTAMVVVGRSLAWWTALVAASAAAAATLGAP
jgi:carbonic anhydrase